MVNVSVQALSAMLMEAYGDDYFTLATPLTTSAGDENTSLPADFLKLKKLYWQRGADDFPEIKRGQLDDLRDGKITARDWNSYFPRFRIARQKLLWMPPPVAVYTVRLYYVYAPADLSADGDTFDAGPGWEEWVVCDVCRKIREREEADPSEFIAMRNDAEMRVRSQAPDRYEGDGLAVRDVMKGQFGYGSQALRDWLTRETP
jgi:hypothetical protein